MSDYLRTFISLLFQVLTWSIFVRAMLSWIDPTGNWRITQVLRDITEPIVAPIRSLLPNTMMIDFSPFIAMVLLQVFGKLILGAIH